MNEHDKDELKVARVMQHALMPRRYPVIPVGASEAESAVRFAHFFEANGQVGGDLFSIFPFSENRVGVFICDVMGHGVRAALVTGIILGMLRQLAQETRDPARMLTRLNHQLSDILAHLPDGIFTTAFFMVLDAESGTLTYANAGHPPPLVLKKQGGDVVVLEAKEGTPSAALALMPNSFYQNVKYRMEPGDRILLYTDGITEVVAPDSHYYGEETLLNFAKKHNALPADRFLKTLVADLRSFSGRDTFPDDACMVWTELHHLVT